MTSPDHHPPSWSRRGLFSLMAAGTAALFAGPALAGIAKIEHERRIKLINPHTGERLDTVYWIQGTYVPEVLDQVNFLLRDHHNGRVHETDPALLDVLHRVRSNLDTRNPFEIVCGYRSPTTNEMLRKKSTAVAKHSYHVYGKAIDIRMDGVAIRDLHKAALSLRAGGVGKYPKSKFVHIDTGPVRHW